MHVRCANYQAAIWRRALHPGISLPGPHCYGWLCKPEWGDDPASHSSVEIQWMTRTAAPQPCWTWSSAVAQRVAPHSVYMQQRTFWLKWSLSLHKLQESVTPVNTVRCTRMTKRLMVTHNLILHCVVLLQLSECWKDSGQLIIPVYSIFFFFFYYIPKTLLKTRNGGTYNKRENRLRYGH